MKSQYPDHLIQAESGELEDETDQADNSVCQGQLLNRISRAKNSETSKF